MQRRDTNQKITVKPAPSGGLGIFACVDFEPDEYIYSVEYEREITKSNPLDPERGERREHCAYPDGKVMLVASPGRYMNHNCDPSAYYRYDGSVVRSYARRPIAAGAEITVDYLINNPGGDSWSCLCGSRRCRGKTGTSFFELPLQFQIEYYPLLADWFKERFPKEISDLQRHLG